MTDQLRAQLISPEVHASRRVTFRLRAPAANSVIVSGIAALENFALQKGDDGVFQGCTPPLEPDLYSYQFLVDGTPQVDPSNRHVKRWLTLESLLEVPGNPPRLTEETAVAAGTLHHHRYSAANTSPSRHVVVYTPAAMTTSSTAQEAERYPILFLLHGYGDDQLAWTEVGRVHRIADNLAAQGAMAPIIIAMPNGHPLPLDLSRDFDDYAHENIDHMTIDLLHYLDPFLAANYPISTDSADRAIAGLSMGGGQALSIGLNHAASFRAVGGFSAAPPRPAECAQYARQQQTATLMRGERLLWIGCGEKDFLLARNRAFVAALTAQTIPHQWHLTPGDHDWTVWRDYVARFLIATFPRRV